jgi:hypothetical protein
MRFARTAAVAGAGLLIAGLGSTAFAAATLSKTTIDPNGSTADRTITVSYTGQLPNQTIFISQCVKNGNTAQTFDPLSDCSVVNSTAGISNAEGVGSTTYVFWTGLEANLNEWNCGPANPNDPTQLPADPSLPSGTLNGVDTCWVRLVAGDNANTSLDEFYPVSIVTQPPVEIPEAPLNVLLPAAAAMVLGGGLLIARKRQSAQAV